MEDRDVAQIQRLLAEERVGERGIMPNGLRWLGFLGQSPAEADQDDSEEGASSHQKKRRKGLNSLPI